MSNQAVKVGLYGEFAAKPFVYLRPTAVRTATTTTLGSRYRQRIRVTNGTSARLRRFPYALDLGLTDALVSGGKAQADGDDLRVAIYGQEIARTLNSWNDAAVDTLVWVMIDSIGPGESIDFDVLYGNASATSPETLAGKLDAPVFNIADDASATRSDNSKWVYYSEQVAANAGLGAWWLGAGTTLPATDFSQPGAWQPIAINANGDDSQQMPYTAFDDSGTKYIGIFDASRARGGSSLAFSFRGADGVYFQHPGGIESVRCQLLWLNQLQLDGGDPVGRLQILGRRGTYGDWVAFYDNDDNNDTLTTIATATYTPTGGNITELAFSVQPYNSVDIPSTARSDRYCAARWGSVMEVNLDDSLITQSVIETEQEVYEFASSLRVEAGPAESPAPGRVFNLGNWDERSGRGTPRLTAKIDEQIKIDTDKRSVEIWNTALTAKQENVWPTQYEGRRVIRSNYVSIDQLDTDWLQMFPASQLLDNPSADTDTTGWSVFPEGATTVDLTRDDTVADPSDGGEASFKFAITANAVATATYLAWIDVTDPMLVQGRDAAWFTYGVRSSNANIGVDPYIIWYDADDIRIADTWVDDGLTALAAADTWYRRAFSAAVPEGAYYWRFGFEVRQSVGSQLGNVWIDTVYPYAPDLVHVQRGAGPLTITVDVAPRLAYA
jgi:hypothetical protein